MIQFVIKIIFCFTIIYSCHNMWDLLKMNYSKKVTKNLVNTQISKYKQIVTDISENNIHISNETNSVDEDSIKFHNMNAELMSHMNDQAENILQNKN